MAAGKYNFTIEQGANYSLTLIYKDSDGDVVNLTGCTARMQFRSAVSSATTLFEATTANGRLVITPLEGKIVMALTATTTAAFTWTSAYYDLEIVAADNSVTRLLQGYVEVSFEITR